MKHNVKKEKVGNQQIYNLRSATYEVTCQIDWSKSHHQKVLTSKPLSGLWSDA